MASPGTGMLFDSIVTVNLQNPVSPTYTVPSGKVFVGQVQFSGAGGSPLVDNIALPIVSTQFGVVLGPGHVITAGTGPGDVGRVSGVLYANP